MADDTTTTATITLPTTGDGTGAPEGQNAGTGNGGTTTAGGERITLTTAQLDERLERARQSALAQVKRDQDARDRAAEEERLKAQGEHEKLAAQAKARVSELEPQLKTAETERDALREHVNGYISKQAKDWPADYRALIPEEDDALARWQAFERVQKVVPGQGAPRTPGNTPSPAPRGNGQPAKSLVDQEKERLLATGWFTSG
jgi:small-conductance mechanosensitive channel